ncbi:bifunctional adenosylcobinamide kinase/adenosylcobinamide-phosphate guanylyltransferase [Sphingopyxis sp. MWB1]|uniref:bifunctional adenosylcobinamide kinase/adenosylcobinamide-phosphate guanylyltransferase n=1 Tax=Sphingopyxis sp. MWB1 TaxID=1537715 RepID=UPI00051A4789|nr:bifunctional adenosylcobinamide kinase/adenosylcobinamide-phosphate guanylyltransferase [Sphingopyxis sp. MWB1]
MSGHRLFVLGGARSGKSLYAQQRAEALGAPRLHYIATAEAWDAEMVERIAQHRADRGPRWATVEAPLELADQVAAMDAPDAVLLVDCLTLWTSNLLLAERDVEGAAEALCDALARFSGHILLVANEVGLGIVPDNPLARRFRDLAGRLNQQVAAVVDEVVFMAAGLPMTLKPAGR